MQSVNFLKNPRPKSTFWKRINRMRQRKATRDIGTIIQDGVELKTDEEKADGFANRLKKNFTDNNKPNFDRNTKNKVFRKQLIRKLIKTRESQ